MAKPSFTTAQAADQIAAYGWSNPLAQPISYGFRSSDASDAGFQRFTQAQIVAVDQIMPLFADVANVAFARIGTGSTGDAAYTNAAEILFAQDTNSGGYAWAWFPGTRGATSNIAGNVFINPANGWFANPTRGTYDYMSLIHEIGHAMGLDHPGKYDGGSPTYAINAEYVEDTRQYTVMSYFDESNTGANHGSANASTLLLHDIAALQLLYGANMTTRTGNTVYGFNSNANLDAYQITSASQKVVFAIWDAGGLDTLDFSGYTQTQTINLNAEAFSSVGGLTMNVAIAAGATIENAVGGAGADTIIGNAAANSLTGNAGNDSLGGGAGDDFLAGGSGNDTLDGGVGFDYANYAGSTNGISINLGLVGSQLIGTAQGSDTLVGIEGVYATDFADAITLANTAETNAVFAFGGNDTVSGLAGFDYIDAGDGNDVVDPGAGDDYVLGGAGSDTINYGSASAGVFVNLAAVDVFANSGANYTGGGSGFDILSGIENTIGSAFADFLYGSAGANALSGGAGSDVLFDFGGNDSLDGGEATDYIVGGAGADRLTGGAGQDYFYYYTSNEGGDTITDWRAGGMDLLVIMMSSFGLTGLSQGQVSAVDASYFSAAGATVAHGQFLWNATTGTLSWDADGTGAATAVSLVTLSGVTSLSAADILLL